MKQIICGIYKITNNLNNKSYIGQSQDIYRRWQEHRYHKNRRDCRAIYDAFRKYGIENFSFEILEECSVEQLNEREIYYIELYNTYVHFPNSNGYNMTKGGAICFTHVGNSDQGTVVYQYDLGGNFISEYRNQHQAALAVGLKSGTAIRYAIKHKTKAGNFQWRLYKQEKIKPYIRFHKSNKVYQYNLNGDFLQEYSNIDEAAKAVNCSRSLIEVCCEHHCKTGRGFQWSYDYAENIGKLSKIIQPSKWKPILCYDIDDNLLYECACTELAHEKTGVTVSAIRHCLAGETKSSSGFKFKYKKEGE